MHLSGRDLRLASRCAQKTAAPNLARDYVREVIAPCDQVKLAIRYCAVNHIL